MLTKAEPGQRDAASRPEAVRQVIFADVRTVPKYDVSNAHIEIRAYMAMGTTCRAHGPPEVYGPCTASRVRFARLPKAQPALDTVSGRRYLASFKSFCLR